MAVTTTNYVYDGTDIVRETTLGLPSRTVDYVYGADGLITSFDGSNRKTYTYDALGSTRELTDEDGDETDTYDYDAWGNIRSSTGSTYNPFRYVGQLGYQYDAADGMYLLQQRYYDQVIGRFLTRDPAREGANWHLYVEAEPTARTDPTGLGNLIDFCRCLHQRMAADPWTATSAHCECCERNEWPGGGMALGDCNDPADLANILKWCAENVALPPPPKPDPTKPIPAPPVANPCVPSNRQGHDCHWCNSWLKRKCDDDCLKYVPNFHKYEDCLAKCGGRFVACQYLCQMCIVHNRPLKVCLDETKKCWDIILGP